MQNLIHRYLSDLQETLNLLPIPRIEQAIKWLHRARLNGRQIFIMGNGGSASTATHFVCDLAKNTRHPDLPPYRVIGLSDNMALLSAYANDEGYAQVFAQQLLNLVQPNDIVIAISTSGNSPNVVEAAIAARQHQAKTIAFTGFDSGKLGNLADLNIHVPSSNIEQVEDIHLMLAHLICSCLRETTFKTDYQFDKLLKVPSTTLEPMSWKNNGT